MAKLPRQNPTYVLRWIRVLSWLIYLQLREGWRMLLFLSAIALLANVFLCSIPLFSADALQASLQSAFSPISHPYSRILRVGADASVLTNDQIGEVEHDIDHRMSGLFGDLALAKPIFSVESWAFTLQLAHPVTSHLATTVQIRILSAPDSVMRGHLNLIQGTFPQQKADAPMQLVIPATTAYAWRIHIGDRVFLEALSTRQVTQGKAVLLPASIVGISAPQQDDPIFGRDLSADLTATTNQVYPVLGNIDEVLGIGGRELSSENSSYTTFSYYWTYLLNADALRLGQIDQMVHHGDALVSQIETTNLSAYHLNAEYLDENDFLTTLEIFQTHVILIQAPITVLIVELLGFVLFYFGVIGEYASAWRLDTSATLRSRGVDKPHLVCSLALQYVVIGLAVMLLSPLLSALLVLEATNAFGGHESLPLVMKNLLPLAWSVAGYAMIGGGVFLLAMIFLVVQTADTNGLVARRELSRESRKPLWQRLYVDIALAVVGGAGLIGYHQVDQSLGSYALHTNKFVFAFSVLAPILVIIAIMLLFSRLYPAFLQFCSYIGSISRGAILVIALAKIARTPRRATNMALLLSAALSLSCLTTATVTTQQQRAYDVASLAVGADFQGITAATPTEQVQSVSQKYRNLQGVVAVSAGAMFVVPYTVGNADAMISVLAMDANTFSDTAYWSPMFSHVSLHSLTRHLIALEGLANTKDAVPAIADASTWSMLGLSAGSLFELTLPGYTDTAMKFVAIDRVQYLPSVIPTSSTSGQEGIAGGILVDYQTLKMAYTHDVPNNALSPSTVWIRTKQTAQAVASVRSFLSKGPNELHQLQDRWALIDEYQRDPIQIDLLFAQIILTASITILVFLSLLYDTWFEAEQQKIQFGFLQSLGVSIRQLYSILLWEQVLTIITGLVLGVIGGWVLTQSLAPMLVFTQFVSNTGESGSTAFDVPPVQVVIPVTALVAGFGTIVALWLMGVIYIGSRTVRNPLQQTLRLNED